MPKEIPYKKIGENKYEFNNPIKISGYDCRIQAPKKLGDEIGANTQLKITIEVIQNE